MTSIKIYLFMTGWDLLQKINNSQTNIQFIHRSLALQREYILIK